MRYDPDHAPDPTAWLALTEDERLEAVAGYGEYAGSGRDKIQLHRSAHVIVETQIAMGDETPAAATAQRLMDQGLSRHDAVHAIGCVLLEHASSLLSDNANQSDYAAALERLTPETWHEEYGEPDAYEPELAALLDGLAASGPRAREALAQAKAMRTSVTDDFIRLIEAATEDPSGAPHDGAVFLIFHLLAEWRETRAYRPLLALLRLPEAELHGLIGDGLTETAHRVIAAVFDGDAGPLHEIILDAGADEFVRGGMFSALAMLTVEGRIPRDDTKRFLLRCYAEMQPQGTNHAWAGWQETIAVLGLHEMHPLVVRAFEAEWIDPALMGLKHFEDDLAHARANPEAPFPAHGGDFLPFGEVEEELARWPIFSAEDGDDTAGDDDLPRSSWPAPIPPTVNLHRNVGRNDPCPCGSGKKFKKCCLDKLAG
jgi:hypothetical protein